MAKLCFVYLLFSLMSLLYFKSIECGDMSEKFLSRESGTPWSKRGSYSLRKDEYPEEQFKYVYPIKSSGREEEYLSTEPSTEAEEREKPKSEFSLTSAPKAAYKKFRTKFLPSKGSYEINPISEKSSKGSFKRFFTSKPKLKSYSPLKSLRKAYQSNKSKFSKKVTSLRKPINKKLSAIKSKFTKLGNVIKNKTPKGKILQELKKEIQTPMEVEVIDVAAEKILEIQSILMGALEAMPTFQLKALKPFKHLLFEDFKTYKNSEELSCGNDYQFINFIIQTRQNQPDISSEDLVKSFMESETCNE